MTKRLEDSERVRRAYASRGERSQIRVGFLLDNEHREWLQRQPNKSRYLNGLIAEDIKKQEHSR